MECIGWLSPTGELAKCDRFSHLHMAIKITKAMNLFDSNKAPDDILLRLGWARISRMEYGDYGLAFWLPKYLSVEQRMFLQEVVATNEQISEQGKVALCGIGIVVL